MTSHITIPILENFQNSTLVNQNDYKLIHNSACQNPEFFWAEHAKRIDWIKPFHKVKDVSFIKPVHIKWFEDGMLNVSYNCLDRHLPKYANKIAYIWEPDDPKAQAKKITYQELFDKVNRCANVLKKLGVKKHDCVTIYMPMIPEAIVAMLACARIGAMHSVVFGGFAPESLVDRMQDGKSTFIITANIGIRAGKIIPLKQNVDIALDKLFELNPSISYQSLVFQHSELHVETNAHRDRWYHDIEKEVESYCTPEPMRAEDPLFILYTSGSTNKPKGVLHTTGGYLVYASMTHEYVFDIKENDIYWCTADVGWITGHSYIVYGPLSNATTSVIYEGVPNYPTPSRVWQIVDKHQVSIFYTAPTAIRALMREGESPVRHTSRLSLRLLGTVGEPINPEVWMWYFMVVGDERCPIVDTWWQTETGGILLSPLPGATPLKPGSATKPFFGIQPELLTAEGQLIQGAGEGVLVLKDSWPGQMRTVFGDHQRFEETYFSTYPGYYFTGDGCKRDQDGYYWISGRVDDVLNVSGHRLGTAEIESAIVKHPKIAEAAVVAYPHDIKGQGIYVFVTPKVGITGTEDLRQELIQLVRQEIGAIATPDLIQWALGLPKTRSGKIMRRILRKIAEDEIDKLGDTSTLADPSVVEEIVQNRLHRL